MCGCVGKVLYAIVQFAAFVFIVVGTPLDMFRPDDGSHDDLVSNSFCITLWGAKDKCYSTTYDIHLDDMWPLCDHRVERFKVAEAFAIVSVAVFGVAALFGFIQLCTCPCFRWLCLVLNILGIGTACVTWALMATCYNGDVGDPPLLCGAIKDLSFDGGYLKTKYGAGFILYIVGWALCVIAIIFLMLPC